jgi:hypothetical protein
MDRILLDPYGDAELPEGYKLIKTEVVFLQNALSEKAMLIRGKNLCKWAKIFYKGREIEVANAYSFAREMQSYFTKLSEDQALVVKKHLEAKGISSCPRSAIEVMKNCYPDELWSELPTTLNAARWLNWLDQTNYDETFQYFINLVSDEFSDIAVPDLQPIFNCKTKEAAAPFIEKWITHADDEFSNKMKGFPLPLAKQWNRIKNNYWSEEIINCKGLFFDKFMGYSSSKEEKEFVISKTIAYFKRYPSSLEDNILDKLSIYASKRQLVDLYEKLPLPAPGAPPSDPEQVFSWFSKQYLPHRSHALKYENEEAQAASLESARNFAAWYLNYYPGAKINGKLLSPNKIWNAKQSLTDTINLIVILDGLNGRDGEVLLEKIDKNDEDNRLQLIENSYAFSPLPTVTEFTKPYLLRGTFVGAKDSSKILGEDISDNKTPAQALQNAKPGDIVFWRMADPDITYHKESNVHDIENKVDAALYGVSKRILEVISNLEADLPLKLIITTDHGRMLGKSQRDIDLPEGLTAHGRAAWGPKDRNFDENGFEILGDLAYLSPSTFGLDHMTVVILNDHAFKHDRYKEEVSPHGGLFPEEVLVPWITYQTKREVPVIKVAIEGSNEANKSGSATIKVTNSSSLSLSALEVCFDFGQNTETITLEKTLVVPMQITELDVNLNKWPSSDQIETGMAEIDLQKPNLERITVKIDISKMKSESMSKRDNILGDLF